MKPGRNDPCPCGSGKKYKKPQNLRDTRKDDFLSTPETLLEAVNSLRSFVLDKKPHIKEYHKIRKLHTEIANAMIQYYYDGKFDLPLCTNYNDIRAAKLKSPIYPASVIAASIATKNNRFKDILVRVRPYWNFRA